MLVAKWATYAHSTSPAHSQNAWLHTHDKHTHTRYTLCCQANTSDLTPAAGECRRTSYPSLSCTNSTYNSLCRAHTFTKHSHAKDRFTSPSIATFCRHQYVKDNLVFTLKSSAKSVCRCTYAYYVPSHNVSPILIVSKHDLSNILPTVSLPSFFSPQILIITGTQWNPSIPDAFEMNRTQFPVPSTTLVCIEMRTLHQ